MTAKLSLRPSEATYHQSRDFVNNRLHHWVYIYIFITLIYIIYLYKLIKQIYLYCTVWIPVSHLVISVCGCMFLLFSGYL